MVSIPPFKIQDVYFERKILKGKTYGNDGNPHISAEVRESGDVIVLKIQY